MRANRNPIFPAISLQQRAREFPLPLIDSRARGCCCFPFSRVRGAVAGKSRPCLLVGCAVGERMRRVSGCTVRWVTGREVCLGRDEVKWECEKRF